MGLTDTKLVDCVELTDNKMVDCVGLTDNKMVNCVGLTNTKLVEDSETEGRRRGGAMEANTTDM